MKKIFSLTFLMILIVSLAACSKVKDETSITTIGNNTTNTEELASNNESLAVLSYLSSGMLDVSISDTTNLASSTYKFVTDEEEFVIDDEIDSVNIYMDKLKLFMDDGASAIGNISEETSTREGYDSVLKYSVNDIEYIIYYTLDELTGEIIGLIILDDIEYELVGHTSFKEQERDQDRDGLDADEDQDTEDLDTELDTEDTGTNLDTEDTDTDQDTEDTDTDLDTEDTDTDLDTEDTDTDLDTEELDDDATEEKMVLTAKNGDNFIKITYKKETEEDESSIKFQIQSKINNMERETKMKIVQEQNEYKIHIEENEDEYIFKRDTEEDGIVYKLNYKVDGVSGAIKIIESTNEAGEVEYEYKITERNKVKSVKKGAPEGKGKKEKNTGQGNL